MIRRLTNLAIRPQDSHKTMNLIYISHGNIPSKWAHTVQTMKMAEALSPLVDEFTLVTGIHWSKLLRPRFDFEAWYGIRSPFRIKRLQTRGFPTNKIFDHVFSDEFSKNAVHWAATKKPSLIYTRTPACLPHCVDAQIPFVFESHNIHDDEKHAELLQHCNAPNLVAIVTISEFLRDKFVRDGIPQEKLLVSPDAVDLSQFRHQAANRDSPKSEFVAGYCGHLYPDRGLNEIVEAAAALPQIQFRIAGGWENDINSWRERTKPLQNLEFVGHLNHKDVPRFLTSCNCLLMPYSQSCATAPAMSPMKMFEYMASNRPIIATDLPSLKTVLRNEHNSLLVRPDDAQALTSALARLAKDQELASRIAKTARSNVAEFTWAHRARNILEFASLRSSSIGTTRDSLKQSTVVGLPDAPVYSALS